MRNLEDEETKVQNEKALKGKGDRKALEAAVTKSSAKAYRRQVSRRIM
jgi:hypothetical protein